LQFLLAIPTLVLAAAILPDVLRRRQATGALPWRDPAFLALVLSAAVFAIGGVMGFLLAGQDTRTPAHYHGVIAAVNLAVMGVMLVYVLPRIGRPVSKRARVRLQLLLFGCGQAMASCGLFLAGGYGAPRKTPSGAVDLVDEARIGMALNGFGALFAVIGGVLFVATVLHAVLRRDSASTTGKPIA
jgi:heme/copper-type cytochrome/quinol oxidase subunit 1